MSLGRDDVGAGLGVADGRARQQLERRVVRDLAVLEHAAVAVAGVLAEADVGDQHELGVPRARSARSARWTMPSSSQAPEPSSSFSSGIPNRITADDPERRAARPTSRDEVVDREAAQRRQRLVRAASSGPTKSGIDEVGRGRAASRGRARAARRCGAGGAAAWPERCSRRQVTRFGGLVGAATGCDAARRRPPPPRALRPRRPRLERDPLAGRTPRSRDTRRAAAARRRCPGSP